MSGAGVGLAEKRIRRIALLATIGLIGVVPQAKAAVYYWRDSDSGFVRPASSAIAKVRRLEKKTPNLDREAAKPQRPLIISISIAEQRLRLYDANGLFAESPVSTGVPDHPTPMGAFSVIQKHRLHESNIYSGAPMPFMQRITWSGIALHAGVVPGRPASHGCIRMPTAFATKMWSWTKLGARVVITPGPISPRNFSHPLLATVKAAPQPAAMDEATSAVAQNNERASKVEARAEIAAADAKLELRPTIGHESGARAPADKTAATKTADARDALPSPISDASSAGLAKAPSPVVSDTEAKPVGEVSVQPRKPNESTGRDLTDIKQATSAAASSAPPVGAQTPGAAAEGRSDKPAEAVPTDASAPVGNSAPTDNPPNPADLASTIKRTQQIAVFVSRKDSKLYVRQNFAPLFDLPVTITADERPLGTHVFTAYVDKNDANVLHWTVLSLPVPTKHAELRKNDQHASPGRKAAPATMPAETKAQPVPDSPAEALDRLNLPAEAMAKIFDAMSSGGSIIVSDQGIAAGETGEGTDFIVSLR